MKAYNYITILLIIAFTNCCHAQFAVDDFYSIPVGTTKSVNVVMNDIQSASTPMYTSGLWGSTNVTRGEQHESNIFTYYNPDTTFLGPDTCYYNVWKTIGGIVIYDTAMVIFDVIADLTLLPTADFEIEFLGCDGIHFYNTSSNYTSTATWYNNTRYTYHPTTTYSGDTIRYNDSTHFIKPPNGNRYLQGSITLFVSNEFGNSWITKQYANQCTGINEVPLSNISLYPNPANSHVTIDMSKNQDEITRNYTAIEVYNVLGERQMSSTGNGNKVANLDISSLPQGMYVATLVGNKGGRRTLGRFVKE